jgi:hypothetical protein
MALGSGWGAVDTTAANAAIRPMQNLDRAIRTELARM